jgi:hypothetical protein
MGCLPAAYAMLLRFSQVGFAGGSGITPCWEHSVLILEGACGVILRFGMSNRAYHPDARREILPGLALSPAADPLDRTVVRPKLKFRMLMESDLEKAN